MVLQMQVTYNTEQLLSFEYQSLHLRRSFRNHACMHINYLHTKLQRYYTANAYNFCGTIQQIFPQIPYSNMPTKLEHIGIICMLSDT